MLSVDECRALSLLARVAMEMKSPKLVLAAVLVSKKKRFP